MAHAQVLVRPELGADFFSGAKALARGNTRVYRNEIELTPSDTHHKDFSQNCQHLPARSRCLCYPFAGAPLNVSFRSPEIAQAVAAASQAFVTRNSH